MCIVGVIVLGTEVFEAERKITVELAQPPASLNSMQMQCK